MTLSVTQGDWRCMHSSITFYQWSVAELLLLVYTVRRAVGRGTKFAALWLGRL